MPDKMSKEKIDLLRAYGAEVVVAPTDVAPESPESYYRVADRLAEEIPGAFQPNQYFNPANPQAHYESTGPEIWEQTGGRDHAPRRRRRHRRHDHRHRRATSRSATPTSSVIGADPVGSIYSGGEVKPYLVEGVGEDFWPETFDPLDRRPLDHRLRPRRVPDHAPAGADRGHPRRRLGRHRRARRARGRRARSTTPRR